MTHRDYNAKLYVFEGPDNTGKTTLSKAFTSYLNSIGNKSVYYSFPGNLPGTLGKRVYDIHHEVQHAGNKLINSSALQMLHVASHIDAIETDILPKLRNNVSVILDRFWWSTIVYGTVYGANIKSLQKLIEIERIHWNNVEPACIFYICRNQPLVDKVGYWDELVCGYERIVNQEQSKQNVIQIANDTSIEETLSKIIKFITVKGVL